MSFEILSVGSQVDNLGTTQRTGYRAVADAKDKRLNASGVEDMLTWIEADTRLMDIEVVHADGTTVVGFGNLIQITNGDCEPPRPRNVT